jgi:thiamine biosynthesis lipoprotein
MTSAESRGLGRAGRQALTAFVLLASCSSHPQASPAWSLVGDGRPAMGTVLELSLASRDEASARKWIAEAFAEVARLEALLSRFVSGSDVSRLNRSAGEGAFDVDPATHGVLDRALKGSVLTGGAFDPSVGPLVELWWEAARRDRLPSPAELEAARALVGAGKIRLSSDVRTSDVKASDAPASDAQVELLRTGMSIDLGGIAKGYALDRLATSLRGRVDRGAVLSFGQSSAWALGSPPDGPRWRLLLRAPSGTWAGTVELRDQAMSMSSSLGQWSEIEGRRYGHVVDPRSGRPLEHAFEAAVVAPDATWAEILSTALLVLGEEEGLALIESFDGCEAMLIDAGGRASMSSGWRRDTRFRGVDPPAD